MRLKKKVKSVCVPISPDSCGSVISGYVRYPILYQNTYGKKLWAIEASSSISLSDCSRSIQWDLSGNSDDGTTFDIEKLDTAIAALMKLRGYMVEAEAEAKLLEKEMKARNKELGEE